MEEICTLVKQTIKSKDGSNIRKPYIYIFLTILLKLDLNNRLQDGSWHEEIGSTSPEELLTSLIRAWVHRFPNSCTLNNLIDAFRQVDMCETATLLEESHPKATRWQVMDTEITHNLDVDKAMKETDFQSTEESCRYRFFNSKQPESLPKTEFKCSQQSCNELTKHTIVNTTYQTEPNPESCHDPLLPSKLDTKLKCYAKDGKKLEFLAIMTGVIMTLCVCIIVLGYTINSAQHSVCNCILPLGSFPEKNTVSFINSMIPFDCFVSPFSALQFRTKLKSYIFFGIYELYSPSYFKGTQSIIDQ